MFFKEFVHCVYIFEFELRLFIVSLILLIYIGSIVTLPLSILVIHDVSWHWSGMTFWICDFIVFNTFRTILSINSSILFFCFLLSLFLEDSNYMSITFFSHSPLMLFLLLKILFSFFTLYSFCHIFKFTNLFSFYV